jgi:NADPH:quinone reductase-like Zn-dependent oxidoreductase
VSSKVVRTTALPIRAHQNISSCCNLSHPMRDGPSWCDDARMKGAVFTGYGAPDAVVALCDFDMPVPNADEVRIEVRAASVNALDWRTVTGTPFIARLATGLLAPKDQRIGVDVAGVVDAVGTNVTRFKTGDAVFGNCRGAFAEYACAPASAWVAIADGVSFEQAASLPVASFTALQALRKGNVAAGRRVLVNGAGGGVGTFAVQLARTFGVHVTAVTHTRNIERVRGLGADAAIDYTREDFARNGQSYDLILDCHATRALSSCRRALNAGGTYIAIGAPFTRYTDPLGLLVRCAFLSAFGNRTLAMMIAKRDPADLATVMQLMKEGKVVPIIDRRFGLDEVGEAMAYVAQGRACGKVVIVMPSNAALV